MTPNRRTVLDAIALHRCSAILRTTHARAVGPALDAAVEGGFRIVEVTLNTPDAFEHIARLRRNDKLCVGAGTVLSVDLAKRAMAAGAQFLVSPVVDTQVIAFCRQHDLVSIPGTYTPSEMMTAHKAGADLIKLFPGPSNGPAYVKACLGPMPFLKIFPTSGVELDNADEWLGAGCHGVGFVGCLFTPEDLQKGRFDAIRERAARMVARVAGMQAQLREIEAS
jgi:2-dehydro-3-deoxyphosphogluconate aldolase/(4S)-4-hydroxy-2-oxoglutarate aldolase